MLFLCRIKRTTQDVDFVCLRGGGGNGLEELMLICGMIKFGGGGGGSEG